MMTDNILILGATGMLGHTLFRCFSEDCKAIVSGIVRNKDALLNHSTSLMLTRVIDRVEVENLSAVKDAFERTKPKVVINCIGVIKQLQKSKDPLYTLRVNSIFPHQLAKICLETGARLIHFSTDCVFDGKKGNYTEDDPVSATDLYGLSKYLGEVSFDGSLTLRTSIIGHELSTSYGLIDWFLSQEGRVKGFTKAIYSGFPTIEIYRILRDYVIPDNSLSGLYQVSSDPISKDALLRLVAEAYGKKVEIEPDDSIVCDRSLNSSRFRTTTGYKPPSWESLVREMHEDYLKSSNLGERGN